MSVMNQSGLLQRDSLYRDAQEKMYARAIHYSVYVYVY